MPSALLESRENSPASIPARETSLGDAERELQGKWQAMTEARVVLPELFSRYKKWGDYHVLGVIGALRQWEEENPSRGPLLEETEAEARKALTDLFRERQEEYGDRLIVSSGATMKEIPKIVYEVCEELRIAAMGVACEKARDYPLGKMKYFMPVGQEWGDESAAFLAASDEIVMLGGGEQAKREALAASAEGKPVAVLRGYGGSADLLTTEDLPSGAFVERSAHKTGATA